MFSIFGTNYEKEANQLLIKLDSAVYILRSIKNSNSNNVSALRIKYNGASTTIKSIQSRVETLKNKFRNQIERKNPLVEYLPNSAKPYISSNGKKYIITKVPPIKTMNVILKNFVNVKAAVNKAAKNKINADAATKTFVNKDAKNKEELRIIKSGASQMLNTAAETRRRINVANAVRSQLGTNGGNIVQKLKMN